MVGVNPKPVAAWAAVLFASLSACDSSPMSASEERSVQLGESFDLKVGESARVDSASVSLTFREVRDDSRCPVDVTCVRAGEAFVFFDARQGDARAELVFEVPPEGGDEQMFQEYRIRVLELAPPARSGSQIDPQSYVATVRIEER